jgi:hypothetical protein
MASSLQPHAERRALRVRLPNMPEATVRFEDGQRPSARLQTISTTGGLLRVLKPLSPGAVVEVMFWTHAGPVLGMAELLSPCSTIPTGLQPFRFIDMDDTDLKTLRIAIASSEVGNDQNSPPTTPSQEPTVSGPLASRSNPRQHSSVE